ncbi:alternative oxidase, mitochondrial [Coccidioides immitis RS]|uniref:Alternative oxidase n=4 Tax=Coccidioides immitis TaxID=5501 RepID=J3KIB6_COCIM|nr:alternative oxidase, mitochondrial [Coccidioides immitis RS]KMP00976.1 alternative oxidase [Coccidioides immitis RMSCC 2394]KMU72788.1 alternative oxidase [Coccidioides immitis RMSCC 3703]KMU83484.1 alternative oxidase [Coccidioides immitis H538.4]TPX26080.1 Alternative oxidase, mitochondrial precursor [Coccidioides immitis]EAS35697.3 alternative oxidase, mitochondrial [Coccidioides immitis RS]
MSTTATVPVRALVASSASARLFQQSCLKASLRPSAVAAIGIRSTAGVPFHNYIAPNRPKYFTTTSSNKLREFFPPPKTKHVVETETHFEHPVFTEKEMKDIVVAHRQTRDWSDWAALGTVRMLRWGMDLATGYKHPPAGKEQKKVKPFTMDERKWIIRFIFLETVAAVPGMVGGMLRHLRSLRRMKRDLGWIETLLEEAYNERMHLLSFLKLAEPGWFMRLMVLGAQGVFFNAFFLSYLVSPRTCHRFVGYLEEEAVLTYTHAINDLENGKLPRWKDMNAPDIAVTYWKMPEGHRKILDLLYYVRADEAKHREVNHTLANLDQKYDPNPYAAKYNNPQDPHPTKSASIMKPTGWERKDVL